MKVLKITIIMLIILMSVGAVCAAEDICDDAMGDDSQDILKTTQNDIYTVGEDSFTNLTDEIESAGTYLDLNHDYAFNNETDNKSGIAIDKDNFVLNGNGRTIDAKNQSRIFNITANNITLSNLILINGNGKEGGAIYSNGTLTLNNVTFTDNYATEKGGAVALYENVTLTCNNTRFIDNYALAGSSIYVDEGNLNLYNSYITSNVFSKRGQIVFNKSKINVENTTFINIASSYTPALYVEEGKEAYIINSKFINLMANITAGALGIKGTGYVYIKDCEFINTTSSKNGGAVLADIAGEDQLEGNVTVLNTIFKDTYSEFGGAYLQLGGKLLLNNTEFTNSHAKYNGGAIYLSYTESEISNCNFTSNGVELNDLGYPTYGGAIFSDISTLNVDNAKFINNSASAGNAIYAYDTSYNIKNSLFENNTNPIYTFFDKEGILENNVYINDDNISTNNELHTSIMIGHGMQLTLINNTINVTTIPASFDLRNYSWVTPVRDQGWMGACWTFGMTSALESALLKATGINADFSENNMQNTMLRYSIYGTSSLCEGGMNTIGTSYLLSWLGAFPQDADTYDELGKISPVITTLNDVHVQDVMFIPNNEIPNGTQLKLAIMKYGALDVSYFGQSSYNEKNPYYNPDTYAQYVNTTGANHEVSVVGWDDNFPKEKFLITPPGNGAWIIKNSWDTDWGDEGYLYVSYYDQSFTTSSTIQDYATAIIIENTEPYNKNYQYNLIWAGNFLANPVGDNVIYCNQFEAMDDDLIAAVGTYFNSEGINYTVEIYVNGDLKLTQEGVSPYLGYHTIKLNEYVPIKEGDIFQAAITSNVMPFLNVAHSRTHYTENISFSCFDGHTWDDNYDYNIIACLKVYTVAIPIAEKTFTELKNAIDTAESYFELSDDYKFNNETDDKNGIFITKDNFILNGNGHTIDANNQSRIFVIAANNVTLSNLILINANAHDNAAIYAEGTLTLDNVTFIENHATQIGGAVGLFSDATLNINNSRFINNYAGKEGSAIAVYYGNLNIYNTEFTSEIYSKCGQIFLYNAAGYVENTTFANIVSCYTPAIRLETAKSISVINSKFINLTATISSGAIGVKSGGALYIKNCEFTNTTSTKNGGAIIADIAGIDNTRPGNVTILDTVFKDTSSGFGGAFIQFGGQLLINNTEFINNHATFNGGSVYISFVDNAEINNCTFTSNGVDIFEGYPTYGGALVMDMSTVNIDNSLFINNTAGAGNAIYTYDSSYAIKNSVFENNTNPIYTFFDKQSTLENNTYVNDGNVSTNNTYFATFIAGEGLQLTLLNNTTNITVIPDKFDLREYGWVSPVRDQGWMGACWTFGITGTLESALLKAANVTTDFSENNMRNTMIRYSIYGAIRLSEGGLNLYSIGYLLSWLGAFTQDADTYDDLGKLSPLITTDQDIHVQDVIFTPNNEIPNGTQLKLAIMKYGSIDGTYNSADTYYNPDNYAHYVNESTYPNHCISIVGWDDNFPKEKFTITPPGDGAWIVKNSWGPNFGENGFIYISYYDKTLMPPTSVFGYASSIIIENTVPYNKNYQYDIFWETEFRSDNGTASYMNVFESMDDDLIAAVGTYFNQSGINYTVEIFVNDELKLTQEGVSPYSGYHTIKLNEYVPIKEGDIFKAAITSNGIPICNITNTRIHYPSNISFASPDGQSWKDLYEFDYIACLKAYTVADDSKIIDNEDITVEYGSAFTVKVATEDGHPVTGAVVNFTINGNTTQAVTDSAGIAKLELSTPLGTYEVTTTYNNKTYTNNVTVKEAKTSISIIEVDGTGIITGILKDTNGKGIENASVAYTSKNANGTTITDSEGKFTISDVSGEIQLTYSGDETYIESDAAITLKNTVPLRTGTSIIADDYETYAIDFDAGERGGYFKVQLVDANGKPLVNKTVFIGFNGKVYNKTTNESGWAQLQINLKQEGTYTFAVAFLGDNDYTGSFVVQKIKVNKKATSISAPSKTYKSSAKTKSYTVTVKTDKGSSIDGKTYLKAGKKITLKVNGKTYTAKTDSNGKATFKLSLTKKGNFKAVVKFAGDKTYKSAQADTKIKIN